MSDELGVISQKIIIKIEQRDAFLTFVGECLFGFVSCDDFA